MEKEKAARIARKTLAKAIEDISMLPPAACLDILASLGLGQLQTAASVEMFNAAREQGMSFEEYTDGVIHCMERIAITIREYENHCKGQINEAKAVRRHLVN